MRIELKPVGFVKNTRSVVKDDDWGNVISEIVLAESCVAECLAGIEDFSHVEVLFYFNRVADSDINYSARHPRNNQNWPLVGIFAQRGKNRPNKIGVCTAKILGRNGNTLTVKGLDAIDGSPVLDIKPVMKEFLPREEVVQPEWATELMKNYW